MYSRNIGIAIYPEKLDLPTTLTYLKQARQHGITRLYATFLQIAMVDAENKDQILNTYQQIFQAAKAMGYEITLDVAPRVFSLLNLAPNDLSYFHNLGVDVMRYDALGDAKLLSELTYNDYGMAIELQMSNDDGSLENIMSFKPLCLKLQGCQNFYPQVWTGLSEAFMRQTNAPFHNHNLKITSYLSSLNPAAMSPWPTSDGCPTLEMMRTHSIAVQAQYYWHANLADDVIIGNFPATSAELQTLNQLDHYWLSLMVAVSEGLSPLEKRILLQEPHFVRPDMNDYFARSTQSRVKFIRDSNLPRVLNRKYFEIGDVVIGNDTAGLYKNELQIIKQRVPYDSKKNLVAHINADYQVLIGLLSANKKFKFKLLVD